MLLRDVDVVWVVDNETWAAYYNSAGTIISLSKEHPVVPIEPGSFGERLAQLICPQFGR